MRTFSEYCRFREDAEGEWWIDNTGDVMFADGDSGEYNHEAHVIMSAQHQIADQCGYQVDDGDWEKFEKDFARDVYRQMASRISPRDQQKRQELARQFEHDPHQFFQIGIKEKGIPEQELEIAYGGGDPRQFAIRYWGWKRVAGNHIESWTLTANDLRAIARGMAEIIPEDAEIENEEFYITTYSDGRSYDVTWAELDRGQLNTHNPNDVETERLRQQANKQVRNAELGQLNPYYQQRTFPFGDGSLIDTLRKLV